ncbi:hypothetical protein [Emticicia sp. TH156]|uniref:hypothetical protein n=1 Tax=Emticicia sp. TH156 TaxID=2067454 RepID=UPI000C75C846|nr:hypothetical protein [Emticicia sp. TH156]PLK42078.1 hypothetical protein C0V77_22790 [Emticicia sp. TH156]
MRTINFLFLLIIISLRVQAQRQLILTEVKYKGQVISLSNNFSVGILHHGDTLFLESNEKGFYLPDSLLKKQRTLLFNIGSQELLLDSIFLSVNPEYLHWTVDIDKRPFLEETKLHLKTIKKKVKRKINWTYTLNKSTGSNIIFFRFTKLKNPKRKFGIK